MDVKHPRVFGRRLAGAKRPIFFIVAGFVLFVVVVGAERPVAVVGAVVGAKRPIAVVGAKRSAAAVGAKRPAAVMVGAKRTLLVVCAMCSRVFGWRVAPHYSASLASCRLFSFACVVCV